MWFIIIRLSIGVSASQTYYSLSSVTSVSYCSETVSASAPPGGASSGLVLLLSAKLLLGSVALTVCCFSIIPEIANLGDHSRTSSIMLDTRFWYLQQITKSTISTRNKTWIIVHVRYPFTVLATMRGKDYRPTHS